MTRRKKGEGTVIEYKPGRWLSRIKVNGKQLVFYGKSEKEVEKALKDCRKKLLGGQKIQGKPSTQIF